MPIDIETFERESAFEGDEPTNGELIVGFLSEHDDKAWTRGEIVDATGLDPNVVSSVLNRLQERGLVRTSRRTGRSATKAESGRPTTFGIALTHSTSG